MGIAVRAARQSMHLTQAELAHRVGVSRTEIAELEAGRIQQPRARVFARLAAVLGLSIAALFASGGAGIEAAALADIESDELVSLALAMVGLAGKDRSWLKDRLEDLRELLVIRRASEAQREGTRRRPAASRRA